MKGTEQWLLWFIIRGKERRCGPWQVDNLDIVVVFLIFMMDSDGSSLSAPPILEFGPTYLNSECMVTIIRFFPH